MNRHSPTCTLQHGFARATVLCDLTLYDSAFYNESTLGTERKIPPFTNEIVLPASGLTCGFAGFPPARAFVSGDTFVSRPPARKQSSQR
jgi:hypothetical protein